MATNSSSSSLVDLGEKADLDDATSKLFFSDTSAPGPGLSYPVPSEIDSTLNTQGSLVALCTKHGVPATDFTPVCADRLGWNACTPPPVGSKKLCVYAAALDAGLRFPLHGFYARVLRHYSLAPSQLAPNSWSYLAAFVLLCRDADDAEPLVSAFRYFFTICAHTHEGRPTGWHHFRPHHDASRRLFVGNLPSRTGWRSRFFFLECPSGWNCPAKWGKPKREHARQVQRTDTVEKLLKLKQEKMGCIDIKVFLANREMPVGDSALASLSALKVEAGAGAAEDAYARKRSRLSPAAVLSQSQPQPLPTSASPGLAPIGASTSGGPSSHFPPPGLAPIRASRTGGSSGRTTPLGFAPIRAASTGGRSGHIPQPQQQSFGDYTFRGSRDREVTPPAPHTMSASYDLQLQLWDARSKASEQAAMIAKINHELILVKTWNAQWQKELRAAEGKHAAEKAKLMAHVRAANNHLNEEFARLNKEHVADREQLVGHLRTAVVEVEELKAKHAQERAELKKELEDEAKQLKEELAGDAEQLKHHGYTLGARDMRGLALTVYKGVISPDDLKVEMLLDYGLQIQAAPPVAGEDQ